MQRPWSLGRLSAIVTGLGGPATGRRCCRGAARRGGADRGASVASVPGRLVAHPSAARSRRLFRAVAPPLVLAVAAAAFGWLWAAGALLAVAVLGVPLGMDRYRSLGHGYDGGTVQRPLRSLARAQATVARSAIIGWRWRQSVFQRRAGVATMKVTVGAGGGGYDAIDVDFADRSGSPTTSPPNWSPRSWSSPRAAGGAVTRRPDTRPAGDRSGGGRPAGTGTRARRLSAGAG